MELKKFIDDFASQLELDDSSEIGAETEFRNIGGWNSLASLSVIAMVDEIYKVKITGNDIRNSKTIEDIFNSVKSKM